MSRWEAWTVHVSSLLVGGSGLLYAWMRYLLVPDDPYAVVNHPLEPAVQHLHLLLAPALVFAAGLVWRRHAWAHFRRGVRERRSSGLALLGTLAPMIASGYLLQTAVDEGWRNAWVVLHVASSLLWLAGWAGHLVALRRAAPARTARASGSTPLP